MKRRRLGNTNVEVSELAFGAWGIGGRTSGPTSYGDTDDKVSLRALSHAFASGITFFDTSNVYGAGHSEELLGRAFRTDRAGVVIATKVGWLSYTGPSDFSPGGIRGSLEGSLKRLQTDYVDLLQLHNPPLNWRETQPDLLETLKDLTAAGKIRAVGVSVRSPEEASAFIGEPAVAAIQANFNMMDTRVVTSGLLQGVDQHKQCLIARTPLCFGFLSGQIDQRTVFGSGDHRAAWSVDQRKRWIEGSQLFKDMVKRYDAGPLSDAALRFCISFSGVATVLSGMLNEGEVSQNAAAINKGALPAPLIQEILALHEKLTFFVSAPADQKASDAVLVKK